MIILHPLSDEILFLLMLTPVSFFPLPDVDVPFPSSPEPFHFSLDLFRKNMMHFPLPILVHDFTSGWSFPLLRG